MMEITKEFRAEIAHRLPNHPGRCANIHGHSYVFQVTVAGPLDDDGMVLDFSVLKKHMEEIIDRWDHALLLFCDDPLLDVLRTVPMRIRRLGFIPTAENMARYIAGRLAGGKIPVDVVAVKVWETATSFAEWRKAAC